MRRKINHLFILLFFAQLITSCNAIVLLYAGARVKISDRSDGRKLDRINDQFDQDGWYEYEHQLTLNEAKALLIDSLNPHVRFSEEFNFLKQNLQTVNGDREEFECIYPYFKNRVFYDFSPTRNHVYLATKVSRNDWENGFLCYLEITSGEFICCIVTEKKIVVPYMLFSNDTIIAKPKPYIPLTDFETYKQSLPSILQVPIEDHAISVTGRKSLLVDTTSRFKEFLSSYPCDVLLTTKYDEIDTNLYEINHKIQYHCVIKGTHHNYYRVYFENFNSISDLNNQHYSRYPYTESYFSTDLKMEYKRKLDKFFKKIF